VALKIGALFAGYGGLDLAVESVLDAEVAWLSEFDDGPSRILAHRYPHAPNLGDVTRIKWAPDCPACGSGMAVYRPRGAESGPGVFYYCSPCERRWDISVRHDASDAHLIPEPVDVITGGSPCQDLSHAGKRAGMKYGTRSGLWAAMCDAVETIRPQLVLWENVRGALSAEATAGVLESCEFCVGDSGEPPMRALGRVLGDLAEFGYDAAWYGLRAADVGAPHGRWRVFVLAWPDDAPDAHRDVLRQLPGAAPLEEAGPEEGHGSAHPRRGRGPVALLPTPVVNDMGRAYTPETWDEWTERLKASHGNGNGHGPSLHVEALRLLKTPTAQLAVNGGAQHPDTRRAGGHGPTLADEVEHLLPTPTTQPTTGNGHARNLGEEARLLPTPRATDGTKGGPNQRGSSGDLMLPSAVTLLPTPRATRGGSATEMTYKLGGERSNEERTQGIALMPTPSAASPDSRRAREDGTTYSADGYKREQLGDVLAQDRFGDYAPAIARWEAVLGRPAPDPTEPTGRDGAHRLSARFVEFMMGLPDDWVTDPAIWQDMKPSTARNAQLKALGNGVVPQQAAAALRWLLDVRKHSLAGAT